MVQLLHNLEWNWNGINSKGIENFLKVMEKVPLTIRRGYGTNEEEKSDTRVNVKYYGTQGDFIISPSKGLLEYIFRDFRGQGFEHSSFYINYNPKGNSTGILDNHEFLNIGDAENRFHFLTKPLGEPDR